MTPNTKTLAMKARVYNKIRKDFYKKRLESFSVSDKVKYFDELFSINLATHWELKSYARQRKEQARIKRGRKPRKKTSKEEWENMKKDLESSH